MHNSLPKIGMLALLLACAGTTGSINADATIEKAFFTGGISSGIGLIEGVGTSIWEDDVLSDVRKENRSLAKRIFLWMPGMVVRSVLVGFVNSLNRASDSQNEKYYWQLIQRNLPWHIPFFDNKIEISYNLTDVEFLKNGIIAQLSSWISYSLMKQNQAKRLRIGAYTTIKSQKILKLQGSSR